MHEFCMENLKKLSEELKYRKIFEVFCCSNAEKIATEYDLDKQIVKISYADYIYPVKYVADKIIKIQKDKPKNSFIAVKVDNCPEWPAYFWGILMAGYRVFLIDFRHEEELTNYLINEAGAVTLLTTKDEEVPEGVNIILADDLLKMDGKEILDVVKDGKASHNNENFELNEEAVTSLIRSYDWADEIAICTSGTTSTAKIYAFNGDAMGHQLLSATKIIEDGDHIIDDSPRRSLAFLPFHHVFGLVAVYLWHSFFGVTQVYIKNRAPSTILEACRNHKVTNVMSVPILVNNIVSGINRKLYKASGFQKFMFKAMCSLSLTVQRFSTDKGLALARKMFKKVHENLLGPDIKCIIIGGGHPLKDSLKVINALGYFTVSGFGMTEVGVSSVETRDDLKYRLAGSLGVSVRGVEYKITPFENTPNIGELFIRGKSIHSGVVSKGKINPPNVDAEGWYTTGDIARIDDGALYIEGRVKEVIINESGENVYPDELEDYFSGNLPGVTHYSVVGIPNETRYEDIVLVIHIDGELDDSQKGQLANSIYKINLKLPTYKKITNVLVTQKPLPLSNGIKVRRQALRKEILDGSDDYISLKMKDLKVS